MNFSKGLIALSLSALFTITACGGDSGTNPPSDTPASSSSEEISSSSAEKITSSSTTAPKSSSDKAVSSSSAASETSSSFQEIVSSSSAVNETSSSSVETVSSSSSVETASSSSSQEGSSYDEEKCGFLEDTWYYQTTNDKGKVAYVSYVFLENGNIQRISYMAADMKTKETCLQYEEQYNNKDIFCRGKYLNAFEKSGMSPTNDKDELRKEVEEHCI